MIHHFAFNGLRNFLVFQSLINEEVFAPENLGHPLLWLDHTKKKIRLVKIIIKSQLPFFIPLLCEHQLCRLPLQKTSMNKASERTELSSHKLFLKSEVHHLIKYKNDYLNVRTDFSKRLGCFWNRNHVRDSKFSKQEIISSQWI